MQQHALSTRYERLEEPDHLPATPGAEETVTALRTKCARLQILVGELLVKNQDLRHTIARLQSQGEN